MATGSLGPPDDALSQEEDDDNDDLGYPVLHTYDEGMSVINNHCHLF